jgi:hypothetical protein
MDAMVVGAVNEHAANALAHFAKGDFLGSRASIISTSPALWLMA